MATFCDACETKLNGAKSECCKADIWAELRALSTRYICKECDAEV